MIMLTGAAFTKEAYNDKHQKFNHFCAREREKEITINKQTGKLTKAICIAKSDRTKRLVLVEGRDAEAEPGRRKRNNLGNRS